MTLRRYPHTAKVIVKVETTPADGISVITPTEVTIEGRYEPASQNKALDYSAKFYCKKLDVGPFEYDGLTFIYEEHRFKITQLHNYQTHCEIWLE